MRKIFSLAIACCVFSTSFSQGTITGKILFSTDSSVVALATVTVFKAADTSIITYRLSNHEGNFKISGIPLNLDCRLIVSYSGFSVHRQEFIISSSKSTIAIDSIFLSPEAKSLDEVLVFSERPPVIIKNDTIEFNASAFKTLPTALVEDLLKKLPGVMVDKDGGISVNGKKVNRLLVDGKSFFGNNPKMATRNLPANVIDKVEVTDDKDELEMNGDNNLNYVGKVINLRLKKGVKKGWFGKVYAGGGSDNRYEAGAIANIYRDTLQLSTLGYINNLNKPGFDMGDIMSSGGFDRVRGTSGSGSMSMWTSNGGSGLSINGVSFGGMQNEGGISISKGAGFNLNHAPNKKQSLYLQYFFGNVKSPGFNNTKTEQFLNDTIITNQTNSRSTLISNAHKIGIGVKLTPDSVTVIDANANYIIGLRDEESNNNIYTINNKIGNLTNGLLKQNNSSEKYAYDHRISFSTSRPKKGRKFTFSNRVELNKNRGINISDLDMEVLYPGKYDSLYAQLRDENQPSVNVNTRINFYDDLGKKWRLITGAAYQYNKNKNDISTFNRFPGSSVFDVFNMKLSSNFNRVDHRTTLRTGIEYYLKDFRISTSLGFLAQDIHNTLAIDSIKISQNLRKPVPSFSISYKKISFDYDQNYELPGFNMINPLVDITNPYNIFIGNPNLVPTVSNNFSINLRFNNQEKMLQGYGWFNAVYKNNDVVQGIVVDAKGVQTIRPINAGNSNRYSMNFNVSKQYKNKSNTVYSWSIGNYSSINKSQLLFNHIKSLQTTFYLGTWVNVGLNLNDVFEWNIGGSIHKNFTTYTSAQFKNLNITSKNFNNEFVLRMPKHFIWETQLKYDYNGNIPRGLPKESIRWNAALNITMFKGETGVLKLGVNDILNRNNSIWVNASGNMLNTSHSNILRRYFLATFTYNIRPTINSKVGGSKRLFWF